MRPVSAADVQRFQAVRAATHNVFYALGALGLSTEGVSGVRGALAQTVDAMDKSCIILERQSREGVNASEVLPIFARHHAHLAGDLQELTEHIATLGVSVPSGLEAARVSLVAVQQGLDQSVDLLGASQNDVQATFGQLSSQAIAELARPVFNPFPGGDRPVSFYLNQVMYPALTNFYIVSTPYPSDQPGINCWSYASGNRENIVLHADTFQQYEQAPHGNQEAGRSKFAVYFSGTNEFPKEELAKEIRREGGAWKSPTLCDALLKYLVKKRSVRHLGGDRYEMLTNYFESSVLKEEFLSKALKLPLSSDDLDRISSALVSVFNDFSGRQNAHVAVEDPARPGFFLSKLGDFGPVISTRPEQLLNQEDYQQVAFYYLG